MNAPNIGQHLARGWVPKSGDQFSSNLIVRYTPRVVQNTWCTLVKSYLWFHHFGCTLRPSVCCWPGTSQFLAPPWLTLVCRFCDVLLRSTSDLLSFEPHGGHGNEREVYLTVSVSPENIRLKMSLEMWPPQNLARPANRVVQLRIGVNRIPAFRIQDSGVRVSSCQIGGGDLYFSKYLHSTPDLFEDSATFFRGRQMTSWVSSSMEATKMAVCVSTENVRLKRTLKIYLSQNRTRRANRVIHVWIIWLVTPAYRENWPRTCRRGVNIIPRHDHFSDSRLPLALNWDRTTCTSDVWGGGAMSRYRRPALYCTGWAVRVWNVCFENMNLTKM